MYDSTTTTIEAESADRLFCTICKKSGHIAEHHRLMPDVYGKIKMSNKDLLKWIENNIIKPYEGILVSKNKCCVDLHEKITGHSRDKFNELSRILE